SGERHRPPATSGPRQGGLPAVRTRDRRVAVEGLLRRDRPRRLKPHVVADAPRAPERRASRPAQRGRLRPRGQVPRARERPLRAVLPLVRAPVPAPPGPVPGRGPDGTAPPLLDLRKQGGGRPALADARDGPEPAVAGGLEGRHRRVTDGRRRAPRVFRTAPEVAGRAG